MAAIVGLLAIAPVAQADYYISKRRAESFARTEVHDRYIVDGHTGVSCRPQGAKGARPATSTTAGRASGWTTCRGAHS